MYPGTRPSLTNGRHRCLFLPTCHTLHRLGSGGGQSIGVVCYLSWYCHLRHAVFTPDLTHKMATSTVMVRGSIDTGTLLGGMDDQIRGLTWLRIKVGNQNGGKHTDNGVVFLSFPTASPIARLSYELVATSHCPLKIWRNHHSQPVTS